MALTKQVKNRRAIKRLINEQSVRNLKDWETKRRLYFAHHSRALRHPVFTYTETEVIPIAEHIKQQEMLQKWFDCVRDNIDAARRALLARERQLHRHRKLTRKAQALARSFDTVMQESQRARARVKETVKELSHAIFVARSVIATSGLFGANLGVVLQNRALRKLAMIRRYGTKKQRYVLDSNTALLPPVLALHMTRLGLDTSIVSRDILKWLFSSDAVLADIANGSSEDTDDRDCDFFSITPGVSDTANVILHSAKRRDSSDPDNQQFEVISGYERRSVTRGVKVEILDPALMSPEDKAGVADRIMNPVYQDTPKNTEDPN